MTGHTPQDYAESMAKMKEAKEGFTLIKQAVGFHDPAMMPAVPDGGTTTAADGTIAFRPRHDDGTGHGTCDRLRRSHEEGLGR